MTSQETTGQETTGQDKTSRPGQPPGQGAAEPPRWIEQPQTIRKITIALAVISALLLVIDIWIHKHSDFALEHLWGFYGFFGLVGCLVLVMVAKGFRALLMRGEDYYDR